VVVGLPLVVGPIVLLDLDPSRGFVLDELARALRTERVTDLLLAAGFFSFKSFFLPQNGVLG
jgi:hypothetical protein